MSKYIDADKLKAEIERLKKHAQSAKKEWIDEGYNQNAFAEDCRIVSFDHLLSFIDTLPEQPVEGLEEKDFVEEVRQYYSNNCTWDALKQPMLSIITRCARHFAEWQKAKMMEGGYDAFVSADRTIPVLPMKDVSGLGLNYGDKVRVIVIKEDEK